MGEFEGAGTPEACICGTIDWGMLVDRLSMRSPFLHSFRRPEADLSCIDAGSSSGGAEDPCVCRDAGGQDGGDGEEKEVKVVYQGTKNRERGLPPASMSECLKLCVSRLCDSKCNGTAGVRASEHVVSSASGIVHICTKTVKTNYLKSNTLSEMCILACYD